MPVLEDNYIGFNGINRTCVCDSDDHGLEDCLNASCLSDRRGDDSHQPFEIDLESDRRWRPSKPPTSFGFSCKTNRSPMTRQSCWQ